MRFATNSPYSIKVITDIISEKYPDSGPTCMDSLKSLQFWNEKLLPHLLTCSNSLSVKQLVLCTQLHLRYGPFFWAQLDLSQCDYFSRLDKLTIMYQNLMKMRLAAYCVFGSWDV